MKKLLVAACLLLMSHGFGLAQSTITIGDTNIEAAADGDKRSLLLAQQVALSQTATIHSLSFYVMAAHGELRLGVYDASGPGGAPGVRKAQTHSFAPQVGWNTHHVITPVSLAPGNYWLAYLPSGNKLGFVKQNNSGNCWYIESDSNQVLPHTFPSTAISCNPTTWSFYATLKVDAPVNGQCGSANGKAVSSAPTAGLCSLGTASAVTGSGPWNWSCTGSNGGTTASCSAPFSPAPTNGQCGSANGVVVSTAPATGLCSVGLASSVTGTGPWNWSCAGSNDGTTASCSAPLKSSGTGIIPANRMTTWQPGVTYNGGIPNRTTVCATLSPLGGTQDDTAQIQSAINNCPSGQVVKLNAGTFNIYTSIVIANSNVTLRGAGPGTGASGGIHAPSDLLGVGSVLTGGGTGTFLVKQNRNTNNYGLLQISGSSMNDVQDSTNLATDAVLGAYSVTLASNPGITVGTYVLIDENTDNDPDVVWGPSFGGPGDASRSWFSRQDRSLGQMMQVTAVNGNAITFARPFHHTYSVANQAQLTRFSTPWLTGVGVEDLAVMGDTGWGNITMTRCAGCWIKHIESYYSLGTSIWITGSYMSEVRDSYIHETPNITPGGAGYLMAIDYGSAEMLVENNIMWNGNKVIVMRASGGGNVVAYNYMDDSWGETYPDEPEAGVNAGHYTTPHMELIEGNYSHHYNGDSYWGNSIDITVFRNWLSGIRAAHGWLATYTVSDGSGGLIPYADYGGVTGRNAVDIQAYNYRHNLVGNVLGKQGQILLPAYQNGNWGESAQTAFVYETLNTFPGTGIVSMWVMGSYQPGGNWSWVANTYQTILRQGNWDWATGTQTWYASPIGASGTPGNGTPQPIPSSLYLTSTPAFFGTNTWPWVDPSTGTTYTLPAKSRFDAGTPNTLQ